MNASAIAQAYLDTWNEPDAARYADPLARADGAPKRRSRAATWCCCATAGSTA